MTALSSAGSSAQRVAHNDKIRGVARLGLAGHGALYVLLGVLALVLAFGARKGETDQKGAFEKLAANTAGWVLLLVIAIGLTAYGLWQLSQAALGVSGVEDGHAAKERLKCAAPGVVYCALALSAFTVVVNGRSSSSQSKQQQEWTATVMKQTGGRWLVGLIGIVVAIVGIVLIVRAAKKSFEKYFPMASMSPTARRLTETLGLVGSIARGVIVGMVGVLFLTAAIQFDPKKARGVDGALRALRDNPVGPWLLGAVALGLIMFGLFGFCEARWRKL
ncbi:MAG TPA: DUF1206 domain-containing protein [Jatrophihabitantaceae bacterium]|jgi:hypothetical protein|nr:DUF1206 domain-containing protein [Jatrophihabitantaceae bacterium]